MLASLDALSATAEFTLYFFTAGVILVICDGGDTLLTEIGAWFLAASLALLVGVTACRVVLMFYGLTGGAL